MKLRCRNCNTAFDYDKQEGYCPQCGSFTERPVKPVKEKPKKKRRNVKAIWIAWGLLILIPLIGIPAARGVAAHKYEEMHSQTMDPVEIVVGECITIHDYEYTTLKTEWHEFNETRKFLQVEYTLDSIETRLNETYRLMNKTKLYLSVDGEYYAPFGDPATLRRQMADENPYKQEMLKEDYTESLDEAHGSLAFIVPNDAEEVSFMIVVYDADLMDGVVRIPIQKYLLPIQEVTE